MASPAKLAHVVLWTKQLPEMKQWYGKVLGAHVVHENPFAAFMTYDEEHHRVALVDPESIVAAQAQMGELPAGLPGHDRPAGGLTATQVKELPSHGLSHVAFTFTTLKELLENYEELKKDSVVPSVTINHGTTTSMYYSDPDGNSVELQVDNFDTIEEGTAFMESETFARNPVGVLFDADDLLKRLRAGESEAELKKPTW
ncbi:VOC family protein [Amycolatopsis sp. NPDC005232]|uniref:VOC family protein n=1 Tax=Amycolatopsis sp. NPDC005232 TaxID=3157027 RepID=UPI00339E6FEF